MGAFFLFILVYVLLFVKIITRHKSITKGMYDRRDLLNRYVAISVGEDKEEFDKLYKEIAENINGTKVDTLKKENDKVDKLNRAKTKTILLIFFGVLFFAFCWTMSLTDVDTRMGIMGLVYMISIFSIAFVVVAMANKQEKFYKKYNKEYKLTFVKEILKHLESKIDYFPEQGINQNEYKKIAYEPYDMFYADDYMKGNLKNGCKIELADILTKKRSNNQKGGSITLFSGIFSVIESPKAFNESLYIVQDGVEVSRINSNVGKIDLDSQEFESHFNVYGSNKIVAYQILTSDVMQMLTEFKAKKGIRYEIIIKDSKIYMRFFSGPMFEAAKSTSEQKLKNELYRNYEIFKFICELSYKMIDLIKSVEY